MRLAMPGRPRRLVVGLAAAAASLAGASVASACSQDNATYFESFLDTTCLQTPLSGVGLDAFGGLRLDTNGVATNQVWDTDTDFAGTVPSPRVGLSTLATSGAGAGAALTLPGTTLPLTASGPDPILGPTVGAVPDGDNVGGPSVVKIGASSYVMYYTGSAEPGGPTVILRAVSTDGKAWTRAATPNTAVLSPTPGAFDEKGVGAPEVRFDPADAAHPYRMWYSGRGAVFGGIGYATSLDGVAWTKYTGTANPADPPVPVLDHGLGGSGDSFSAADPSVIKDGLVYKMWYTGDDSNRKRINYATSVDGIAWQKGGTVLGPESVNVTANFSEGAYAPVVWKTGATYNLLFNGRKFVSGTTYQTKIQSSSSSDGINWGSVGVGLNPSPGNFDSSNLEAPTVLDEGVDGSERYKLYYAGNALDANGNGHDRIGLATSANGGSFGKFSGPTNGAVLDVGVAAIEFDARGASGLNAALTGGTGAASFVGFYSGTRGSDFLPRLGEATSSDAAAWTKMTGLAGTGGAIFALGTNPQPDNKGAQEPSVLLDGTTYDLYYTGVSSSGVRTVVMRTSAQDATSKLPTNAWTGSGTTVVPGDGSGFDADGASHPSVIKDGGTYVMHYTGLSSGVPEIGRITSAAATFTTPTRSATPVVAKGSAGSFDANGAKDPVVVKLAATDYRMVYTGIDADGIERLGYATSADGAAWTKQGVVRNPSRAGFAFDEVGLRPSGLMPAPGVTSLDLSFAGIDRTGRQRAGLATAPVTPPGGSAIPMGWATYQLGDVSSPPRDFRSIRRTSTGDTAQLWLSFLQPYSSAGKEFWSDFFPVTQLTPAQELNLLLTVKAVRWQARLSNPAGSPSLDKVQIDHAPVSFLPSGGAGSLEVRPASTLMATSWSNLVVTTSMFEPMGGGTGAGTVTVKNAGTGAVLVPATALNTGGDTTVSLAGVDATVNPGLRVEFALTSDGTATPLVRSYTVGFTSVPKPVDATAPINVLITGPSSLSKAFQVTKSLKVTWTATDPESGIARYDLISRSAPIGAGFAAPVTAPLGALTATTFVIKPGTTYCFKIRATNGLGLFADSPERCTAQPLSSYGMSASGIWAKKTGAGYYLGRFRVAKVKGAALIKKGVVVKRLAVVATRAKGAGTVTVFLGTTKLKTIKLAATTTRKRQVIAVANFTKIRKGTVKIVVTSTTGAPVIIEGLAVSKV